MISDRTYFVWDFQDFQSSLYFNLQNLILEVKLISELSISIFIWDFIALDKFEWSCCDSLYVLYVRFVFSFLFMNLFEKNHKRFAMSNNIG